MEVDTCTSLALSTYSFTEVDPVLPLAFKVWRAQTRMRRLVMRPYRRILRRWHRLTEESKRGTLAWAFYRQRLLRRAFDALLYRVTFCSHLTMRLGFKSLTEVARIRRYERDVADEYHRARLCTKALRGLFQAISIRCRLFLRIKQARNLRILTSAFGCMRIEASLTMVAARIHRHLALTRAFTAWRRTLNACIVSSRVDRIALQRCFVRWRQRYRRGVAISRDIYVRQGYDAETALTLALSPEAVRLLLKSFHAWLKRARATRQQRILQDIIVDLRRKHLCRAALSSMKTRYETIVARREALLRCLESIDRTILSAVLHTWRENAHREKCLRITGNVLIRERHSLLCESAYYAWKECWTMTRQVRVRYGSAAASLALILKRHAFQQLRWSYHDLCVKKQQADVFHLGAASRQAHKALSSWYARLLERQNTVCMAQAIVSMLADTAYSACLAHESCPGQWFVGTHSHALLSKAFLALRAKHAKRTAYRNLLVRADEDYRRVLIKTALLHWRANARVTKMAKILAPRLLSSAFGTWRQATERAQRNATMERQASMRHEYALLRSTFCNWRCAVRITTAERSLEETIYAAQMLRTMAKAFETWRRALLQDQYLSSMCTRVRNRWVRSALSISLHSICVAYLSNMHFKANRKGNIFTESLQDIVHRLSPLCTRQLLVDIRVMHRQTNTWIHMPLPETCPSAPESSVPSPPPLSRRSYWEVFRSHREKYRTMYGPDMDQVGQPTQGLHSPHDDHPTGSDRSLIATLDSRIERLSQRLLEYGSSA